MDKKKLENIFWTILVVVVVGFSAFTFLTDDFEHIQDINGPTNYSLNTINRSQIIKGDMGSKGMGYKTTDLRVGGIQMGGVSFYSKQYSGVEELFYNDYILPSDFTIQLYNFEVTEGNFELVVINNGEIIKTIEPGFDVYVHIPKVKGYTSIVAVGESANFKFEMTHSEFDMFSHPLYD